MGPAAEASQPHVVAVVLHHDGRDDTVDCLASLERVRWRRLTVVVVDNGSTAPLATGPSARFSGAEVIRSERNLGFAGGNNLGIRRALELGADHILLLNNDTVADPDLVAELVAAAGHAPAAGALSPLILYAEPPDRIWFAGGRFDARRGRGYRHVGYGERDVGQFVQVTETDHVSGAGMLVPRAVLERVGPLDEDLFLQVEDVDWSLRARGLGYCLYVVPTARLWHRVSATSGGERSTAIAYYSARNTLAVSERHAPLHGLAATLRRLRTLAVHLVHARRAATPLANMRAVIAGWRDFRRGRLGRRGAAA